jgi:hypothetical protein
MAEPSDGEDLDFWCAEGKHTVCKHVPSEWISREGDHWHLTSEAISARLCRCTCHDECAVAGSGQVADWSTACSCPGALALLSREPNPRLDLGEVVRDSLDRSKRRKKAREELRLRASGRTAEETDQIIDEIWTKHGLSVPSSASRPWIIEHTLSPPGYAGQVRMAADALGGTARWISSIVSLFRNDSGERPEDADSEAQRFEIKTGSELVEVIPEERSPDPLETVTDGIFTSRLASSAQVILRRLGNTVEVWTLGSTADKRSERLGLIPDEESARFLSLLRAAERVDQVAVSPAIRGEGPDKRWHLYVKLPLTRDQ